MKVLFKIIFLYCTLLLPLVSTASGVGSLGAKIVVETAKPVAKVTAKVATRATGQAVKAGAKQAPKVLKFSTKNLTPAQRVAWNQIPKGSGKYYFTDSSGKLYIGESNNIYRRLGEHMRSGKLSPNELVNVKYTMIPSELGKSGRRLSEAVSINVNHIKNPASISNIQIPKVEGQISNKPLAPSEVLNHKEKFPSLF